MAQKFQEFGSNLLVLMKKALILLVTIFLSCSKTKQKTIFSRIEVDKNNKTIIFEAKLNLTNTEKYFLFYFQGYPWMKDYCIFVSSCELKELQTALATIDWKLWDNIYANRVSPKLEIKVLEDNKWKNLFEFIEFKNFNTYQTIFWGSPIYDNIVLRNTHRNFLCQGCNLLPLEQSNILSGLLPLDYKFIKKFKKDKLKVKINFK